MGYNTLEVIGLLVFIILFIGITFFTKIIFGRRKYYSTFLIALCTTFVLSFCLFSSNILNNYILSFDSLDKAIEYKYNNNKLLIKLEGEDSGYSIIKEDEKTNVSNWYIKRDNKWHICDDFLFANKLINKTFHIENKGIMVCFNKIYNSKDIYIEIIRTSDDADKILSIFDNKGTKFIIRDNKDNYFHFTYYDAVLKNSEKVYRLTINNKQYVFDFSDNDIRYINIEY